MQLMQTLCVNIMAATLDRASEMSRVLFRTYFFLWPLFLGVFLPYLVLPTIGRVVNIFWGPVYGFGLLLSDSVFGNSIESPFLIFGVLLWPVFVSALLFVFGGLLERLRNKTKVVAAVALFLSSLLSVGLNEMAMPPFNQVPTYWKLMTVVW
jgi:hypothetical protein